MKQLICKISLFLLFIATVQTIQSQENSDLESWTTIGLDYKVNKKLSLGLEQQLRLKTNISEVDNYFTQLNVGYKLNKGFAIGGGLRYIRKNDNQGNIQGYENHFRFHIDASYKHSLDKLTLKYRLRYQNKNELGISVADGDYANQNIRFKTSLGYNITNWKLDPKLSAEIFNHFEEGEENGFSKIRYTLSTDYKFKSLGKIKVFFRLEKELNVIAPQTTKIIGIKYTYTLKNKKKNL